MQRRTTKLLAAADVYKSIMSVPSTYHDDTYQYATPCTECSFSMMQPTDHLELTWTECLSDVTITASEASETVIASSVETSGGAVTLLQLTTSRSHRRWYQVLRNKTHDQHASNSTAAKSCDKAFMTRFSGCQQPPSSCCTATKHYIQVET